MKKILVIGLARNGHHAIINWIGEQLEGKTIFFNNCNQNLQHRNRVTYGSGIIKNKIYSFENFDLLGYKKFFTPDDFDDIIIVMRDPYNWIASSMMKSERLGKLTKPFKIGKRTIPYSSYFCESLSRLDMFYQYMDQILGNKDYIGKSVIDINYNKWFTNKDYRKKIATTIGFNFTDKGKDKVVSFGEGSSFDKRKYNNKGSKMDVLNRWKTFKSNKKFNKIISDDRIKNYSKEYFNFEI